MCLQSDYSNKASETSERDFAIPIQSLRKAIETGVDPGYAIPKVCAQHLNFLFDIPAKVNGIILFTCNDEFDL